MADEISCVNAAVCEHTWPVDAAALLEAGDYDAADAGIEAEARALEQPGGAAIEDLAAARHYAAGNRAMWLFLTEDYDAAASACSDLLGPMIATLGAIDLDVLNIEYCRAMSFARSKRYDEARAGLKDLIGRLELAGAPTGQPTRDLVAIMALERRYEDACTLACSHYAEDRGVTALNLLVRVHCAAAETLALHGCLSAGLTYAETAETAAREGGSGFFIAHDVAEKLRATIGCLSGARSA